MSDTNKRQRVDDGYTSETVSEIVDAAVDFDDVSQKMTGFNWVLQNASVEEVKPLVNQWITQCHKEYTGTTSADIWNLLESQQELLLNKAVYVQKLHECNQRITEQKTAIQQALESRVTRVQSISPSVKSYFTHMHDVFQKEWATASTNQTVPNPEIVKMYGDVLKLMHDGKEHDDAEYPGYVDWKNQEERLMAEKNKVLLNDILVLNNQSVVDYFMCSKKQTPTQEANKPVMIRSPYSINGTEYKTKDDFMQVIEAIQACTQRISSRYDVGVAHPTWTTTTAGKDKCQIQSHVIVFDKNLTLQTSKVYKTQEKEGGGPIFGKQDAFIGDTFSGNGCVIDSIYDTCNGDVVVFGYPVEGDQAGEQFICFPADLYIQGLSDALEMIGLVPLVRLTRKMKFLRKPLCIALFGENLVSKEDNEKHVCLYVSKKNYKTKKIV